ncbi:substrate-binding domain-containing protein, partial [Streptomyces sp. NPDC000405]|uniref:substrate-binding domain-containing protein n=1 Tax=Streptomyces sp. NPDC000405 TaxID=3161033 RepID=UPI00398CD8E6
GPRRPSGPGSYGRRPPPGRPVRRPAGKTGKVKVISVDGVKDALEAVRSGTLDATVAQYPYTIGQMGVEACQAAAKGKTLPKNVKAPVELVTKADADKALASTPKPFGSYDDPFTSLGK